MPTIKYFGLIAELTGNTEEHLMLEAPITLAVLEQKLLSSYQGLSDVNYQIAINQRLLSEPQVLIEEQDEVALLPPFAGG